jgi:hypothetical protein
MTFPLATVAMIPHPTAQKVQTVGIFCAWITSETLEGGIPETALGAKGRSVSIGAVPAIFRNFLRVSFNF